MTKTRKPYLLALLCLAFIVSSCGKDYDVPPEENEEEIITDVKLIFTNNDDVSDVVTARAQDPDGDGVEDLKVLDTIKLDTSKIYTLTLEVMNNLDSPGEDIGKEIEEEAEEHQLFYAFSNGAFSDPAGAGNIDDPNGEVNYLDFDSNSHPLGLSTIWTTGSDSLNEGYFTVRLQHQPDIKDGSSGANDGDTDFELQFVLSIGM